MIPGYRSVTKSRPCEICEKPDWCMISRDGDLALCARIVSGRPFGEAGHIHVLREPVIAPRQFRRRPPPPAQKRIDWKSIATGYEKECSDLRLRKHAMQLGVSYLSLVFMYVGFSEQKQAYSYPMFDEDGQMIGIRFRNEAGRKWAYEGSRNGLFYQPDSRPNGSVLITEGPTDTAAMLSLDIYTVGRASCGTGLTYLLKLCKNLHVAVLADADGPGRRGGEKLGSGLLPVAKSVKIIEPPYSKDAREWKQTTNRESVLATIEAANLWTKQL